MKNITREFKNKIEQLNTKLLAVKSIADRKKIIENSDINLNDDCLFLDERDSLLYTIIRINGFQIMGENLRYDIGANCYHNNFEKIASEGLSYPRDTFLKAIPKGWKIPDIQEWRMLLLSLGGYYDYEYLEDEETFGNDIASVPAKVFPGGESLLDFSKNGKLYKKRKSDDTTCYSTDKNEKARLWVNTSNFSDSNYIIEVNNDDVSIMNSNEKDYINIAAIRLIKKDDKTTRIKNLISKSANQKNNEERKTWFDSLDPDDLNLINSDAIFLDERDYNLYSVVKIGNQRWTGENLRYDSKGSVKQSKLDILKQGRYYPQVEIPNLAPAKSRIPSLEDVQILLNHYEAKASLKHLEDADSQIIKKCVKGLELTKIGISNLHIELLGFYEEDSGRFTETNKTGTYWTSGREFDYGHYYYLGFNPKDKDLKTYIYHQDLKHAQYRNCRLLLTNKIPV